MIPLRIRFAIVFALGVIIGAAVVATSIPAPTTECTP